MRCLVRNAVFMLAIFCAVNQLYAKRQTPVREVQPASSFRYGIEDIPISVKTLLMQYQGTVPRIALATNQTGIDQSGNRMVDVLLAKGYNITLLLAPEHGLSGTIKAGKKVADSVDEVTDLPISSMYKVSGDLSAKDIEQMQLHNIDILLFDMQDSGMRHYTYVSFMIKLIDFAAANNKKIVILDRPNPLGAIMEGPVVEKELLCMVAITQIPLRHGMTLGEIAQYYNKNIARKEADLVVVPMRGYVRNQAMNHLKQPLSPNIASNGSLKGYAFLGLIGSIDPFFVGINTKKAFQQIMLPIDSAPSKAAWLELARTLKQQGVSAVYEETTYGGTKFVGLTIRIPNINAVSSIQLIADVIEFAKRHNVRLSRGKGTSAEYLDKCFGNDALRRYIDGSIDKEAFFERANKGVREFYTQARTCFMYQPLPELLLA